MRSVHKPPLRPQCSRSIDQDTAPASPLLSTYPQPIVPQLQQPQRTQPQLRDARHSVTYQEKLPQRRQHSRVGKGSQALDTVEGQVEHLEVGGRRKSVGGDRGERVEVQVQMGEGGVWKRREGGDSILPKGEHPQRGEVGGRGDGRDSVVGAIELLRWRGVQGWEKEATGCRGEEQSSSVHQNNIKGTPRQLACWTHPESSAQAQRAVPPIPIAVQRFDSVTSMRALKSATNRTSSVSGSA